MDMTDINLYHLLQKTFYCNDSEITEFEMIDIKKTPILLLL